ncbi:MAG: insulinase family protein [Bdellovibrionales bacterium]|nr:insulinase family protein [Bdellovibrionales bacterium]
MFRITLCLICLSGIAFGKGRISFHADPVTENGSFVGPKIFYEKNPTSLTTDISVVVMTGGIDDPIDKLGLSNLVGEMILRGTKKKNREKFQSDLERMGASLSANVSLDTIQFSGSVIKENTSKFLALLEEALLKPAFSEKDFFELKREVLNDIKHIKNSNTRLGGLAARLEMFKGTPLEKPVMGSKSTVEKITLEDIQKKYNNSFDRPKIIFAAAAPFPESDMTESFSRIWRQFPDGVKPTKRLIIPKVPEKPTLIVVHKPKTSTGSLFFAQAGITIQDPERYTLNTGNFSFGGEPLVSRLFKTIRGELGWTYAIGSSYASIGGLSNQQGLYTISSTPSMEFTSKTIFKTLEMWRSYVNEGLSSEEMDLAKDSLVNSYPFEFESAAKRVSHKLSSFLYSIPILTPEEFAEKIGAISNRKLKAALKEKQKSEGWLIALVADKDVIAKDLEEYQKEIPKEQRLTISRIYTPDELVN